ncbi:MAG: hypothetical protein MRY83_18525 [Flavobacteriales bacterium]|nr:hypothetical protein [Flavobacteriales bacterium]
MMTAVQQYNTSKEILMGRMTMQQAADKHRVSIKTIHLYTTANLKAINDELKSNKSDLQEPELKGYQVPEILKEPSRTDIDYRVVQYYNNYEYNDQPLSFSELLANSCGELDHLRE